VQYIDSLLRSFAGAKCGFVAARHDSRWVDFHRFPKRCSPLGSPRREQGDQRLMRKTVLLTLFLCIASGIASTVAVTLTTTQNSYLALAQSDKPLNEIHPERKRLVVEFIRQSAANSAENNRNAAALKPIDPPLYAVASLRIRTQSKPPLPNSRQRTRWMSTIRQRSLRRTGTFAEKWRSLMQNT
jgi:sugar (pentulose or hexulose) kinase